MIIFLTVECSTVNGYMRLAISTHQYKPHTGFRFLRITLFRELPIIVFRQFDTEQARKGN